MVRTIEGRSTACITCLKRKKGCDRQKPFCGQCRKACIPCQGYSRPYIFRNFTAEDVRTSRPPPRSPILPVLASPDTRSPTPEIAGTPWELMQSAYLVNILGCFWRAYLPDGKQLDPQVGHHSTWGMVDAMGHLLSQENALRKAAAALCLATVDLVEDKQWIREHSSRYYTEALHDMVLALARPARDHRVGLISASRIFSVYESYFVAADPQPSPGAIRSWMAHIGGEISLFQTNDPSFYATGVAHRLFVDDRVFLISAGLQQRKTSFLMEEEWKTLPWTVIPKTPRDRILDILLEVPTALEMIDTYRLLVPESRESEKHRQELVQLCLGLDLDLAQWHTDHLSLAQWASQITPLRDMSLPCPLHNQSDIAKLNVMTLYWVTSTLVHSILRDILTPDEQQGWNLDPEASCSKIIIALSNLLHPSIGLFRIHFITVPVSILIAQLEDQLEGPSFETGALSEEIALLAHCFAHPGCASISKYLTKLSHSRDPFTHARSRSTGAQSPNQAFFGGLGGGPG